VEKDETADVLGLLVDQSHRARGDDLPLLCRTAARAMGARELVVYVVDYGQRVLLPVNDPAGPTRETVSIEGTVAGRAFSEVADRYVAAECDAVRLWLPLLNGTERLGVVEMVFDELDDPTRFRCRQVAGLLAEVILTRRLYGDSLEVLRRLRPMALEAEMQWNLLPPLSFAAGHVVVSGILEPSYDVAGDAFDYAVNGDIAHVAVFDAVGHGFEASLLASVAMAAYRNARRSGLNLPDTYRSMNKWIANKFPERFVTSILAELDTRTGNYRWVNAGHHPAMLVRDAQVVKMLDAAPDLPLGLEPSQPTVASEQLQPDDRILLYTDGVVEARDEAGEFFGLPRLADLFTRACADQRPAPETMRRLNHAVLDHQHGDLQDDATMLLLEWSRGAADALA
jgi:serine phosphatase RsbU (regulator of sigma subunit)